MKSILPLICALCFIGCNDADTTTPSSLTAANEVIAELNASPASTKEMNTSVSKPEDLPKPEPEVAEKTLIAKAKPEIKAKPTPSQAQPTEAKSAQKAPETASVDSAVLFKKCVSCHGNNAEKQALGKSQVIAGWPEAKIVEALKGYQAGTYGREMKAVMQGQVKSLKSDEIGALAKHISKL